MLKRRVKPEIVNASEAKETIVTPFTRMHRPKDVADILSVSSTTLRSWRGRGIGPRFVVYPTNAVRYPDDALRAWIGGASGVGPVFEADAR